MKKKIFSLILCVVLAFTFACPVFAAAEDVPFNYMVVDSAELLTADEAQELNDRAWEITQEYGCAVYIITTPSTQGLAVSEYNEYLHSELGMGYGSDQSCIILLLDMEYREYDLMAHGYGNYAFTDYGKDVLAGDFLDDFSNDFWYDGFEDYLDICEDYLERAANGEPFDVDSDKSPFFSIVLSVGISCLVALIVCSYFASQMNTSGIKTRAGEYIAAGGLQLYDQTDVYMRTERTERYIEPEDDNKGGTTVNSSGSSHKSGKF